MDKQYFFTLLFRWPKLTFVAVDIPVPQDPEARSTELYVCDGLDPPARLFIRHIAAETDLTHLRKTYMRWLEEYNHLKSLKITSIPEDFTYTFQSGAGTRQG